MSSRFQLICESIHCFGKHSIKLGSVDSEQEALDWKLEQQRIGKRPALQADDPIRNCPVVRCPLKKQSPRFDYQEITE